MKSAIACAVLVLLALSNLGAAQYTFDGNNDGEPDQWFLAEGEIVLEMKMDRDYDGAVDYLARFNDKKEIVYEEYDFNHDGGMDDFYYYDDEGLLVRQEIDSNFDEKVDIWIFLYQGMYIKRYERDVDHDGRVDLVKDYGSE